MLLPVHLDTWRIELLTCGNRTLAHLPIMIQTLFPLFTSPLTLPAEKRGVVYTKPWVVDLLLDLAGYSSESNLVDAIAVEPAAGEGAFLASMARRLVVSCQRQRRDILDCTRSLIAYEIDEQTAETARRSVVHALTGLPVPLTVAKVLADSWIRTGDYLFDSPRLAKADFVLGNPPYIRLEDIPGDTADFYRSAYSTMRGRADIYVAFFEAALRQLNKGGVCAFICADRWMLNQYGAELRRLITTEFGVQTILEMHNADAFDSEVSAYPAITVIRRGPQGSVVVASAGAPDKPIDSKKLAASLCLPKDNRELQPYPPVVSSAVVEKWFQGADPWPCSSPARLNLLRRLETKFENLEDGNHTKVGIGVATGCDAVFITQKPGLVESSRLLPLALASDTMSGHLKWSGHYLVDPWNDRGLVDLSKFPKLKQYFEQHKDALSKRHTAKKNLGGWYKTIDRVSHSLTSRPKLYIPDIKDEFNPVLDTGATYPHHNLYFVVSDRWDLEVLGGLLLSSVAQLFIEAYGVRMRGGYLRFQAQYLRRVRVPDPANIKRIQRERLTEAFRSRDRQQATQVAVEVYGLKPGELELALGH
jgi:adenine-specific DNA-methyltransferase